MNIHEYQAKKLLFNYGVNVTRGQVAHSVIEAEQAAEALGCESWIVKAQIHAGGRGKGGGVKFARTLTEVREQAERMLGMNLVTHQTGESGKLVQKVYIQEAYNIGKEFYLGIVLDRRLEMPVIMASTEGGVDIETVAVETPEKIIKVGIDPIIGLQSYHLRKLAYGLGLDKDQMKEFSKFIPPLFEAYLKTDASLVEINPLVLLKNGEFIALDAKLNFDDNALYRHPEIAALRDESEEEAAELEAARYELSYVKLDGNVGCIVNGAGLAMSTMDIIKQEGGEPANFLDVGGNASAETVARGFELILRDKNVKAILVNIFGGIVRCDRIANGILEAARLIHVQVPVIVRLDGTNAAEAGEILKEASIKQIIIARDMREAAQLAVQAAKGDRV
ncbi:MAG: ADP-forming succinate--CoA ligase subunit beta [Candidatus Cloacimonetes bacterium]|nr:ADP-forming succinate--CoA ligase subunit beta [Candidatus Cloacimonadota bacterium]